MDFQLNAWASLLIRWAHIIAGIGWIGASFYFMQLDYRLRRRAGAPEGVKGESWSVHGGGFYQIQKYMTAPPAAPEELHWYKWDAYMTWLTGFALMAVVYYLQADVYLIDKSVLELSRFEAVGLSIASLAAGWLVYDALCKSPLKDRQIVMFAVLFVLIVAVAFGLGRVFSPRAAFLHIGAIIGTIMTANVFFVIIPNQKIVVADLKAGRAPNPEFGKIAKLRSTHNNYLTLPVLFLMISIHYPMIFAHPANWVIVAAVLPIGAIIRDYFNAHDKGARGRAVQWQWPAAGVLLLALIVFTAWRPGAGDDAGAGARAGVTAERARAIIETRCVSCHSAAPSSDIFPQAPGGVQFDTLEEIKIYSARILNQTVQSTAMPPGNLTAMTDEERAALGAWFEAGMPD